MLREIILGLSVLYAGCNTDLSEKDTAKVSADTTSNQVLTEINGCRNDIEMSIATITHFVNKSEYITEKVPLNLFFTEELRKGLQLFQIGYKRDFGKDIGSKGHFGVKTFDAFADYYENRPDRAKEFPYNVLMSYLEKTRITDTSTIPLHRMSSPEEISKYCNKSIKCQNFTF